jgi:hypothetical protein
MHLSTFYLVKIMAIPEFFQQFLRIFIQEISKLQNFEYEGWRTPNEQNVSNCGFQACN